MQSWRNKQARRAGAAIVAIGGAFAAVATAGVAIPDSQYEGRAERDATTYVGFDVVRQNGQRKVKGVSARLQYNCQGGGGEAGFARAKGRIRVRDNGTFAGRVRGEIAPEPRGGLSGGLTYRFKGKLKRGGRARGRIDANLTTGTEARWFDPGTRCYTGDVDWRARRGAEIEPVIKP